jgi:hypothetical protein
VRRRHYLALRSLFATVTFASLTTVRSLIANVTGGSSPIVALAGVGSCGTVLGRDFTYRPVPTIATQLQPSP